MIKKLYVKATNPPACEEDAFYLVDIPSCSLYVPDTAIAAYQEADVWKEFLPNIKVDDTAGITPLATNPVNMGICVIYGADGKQCSSLQQGINIIVYTDGTVKKAYISQSANINIKNNQ